MQVRRKIRGPSLCARNKRDSSLREATLFAGAKWKKKSLHSARNDGDAWATNHAQRNLVRTSYLASRDFQRAQASSRAFLLAGFGSSGVSPARMKPWPAPS